MLRQFIETYLCSQLYREIAKCLRFDGWDFGDCTAQHASGLVLWTANGWILISIRPSGAGQGLGLMEKWMLRGPLKAARAREVSHDLIKWEISLVKEVS